MKRCPLCGKVNPRRGEHGHGVIGCAPSARSLRGCPCGNFVSLATADGKMFCTSCAPLEAQVVVVTPVEMRRSA